MPTLTYVATKSVAAQDAAPIGLYVSPDGTKMFVAGAATDRIYRYDLSTAWDLTSASYTSSFLLTPSSVIPQGVHFSSDGTRMFYVESSGDLVRRYSLSTAWDVTTASLVSSVSISGSEGTPTDLALSDDGTTLYVVGSSSKSVHQFALSTAWDITSASHGGSVDVSVHPTISDDPTGVSFTSDGLSMFISETVDRSIHYWDLSTAWDVTTATLVDSYSILAQDSVPLNVAVSPTGAHVYATGNTNDSIYEYGWDGAATPPPTITRRPVVGYIGVG